MAMPAQSRTSPRRRVPRQNFRGRSYIGADDIYDDSARYVNGVQSFRRYEGDGRYFDEVKIELSRDWECSRASRVSPGRACKAAARDAWDRLTDVQPGSTSKALARLLSLRRRSTANERMDHHLPVTKRLLHDRRSA